MDISGLSKTVRTGTVTVGRTAVEIAFDIFPSPSGGPVGAYLHSHSSYEVHAAIFGDYVLVIGGERTHLPEGEGLILPPCTLHHCLESGPGRVGFCYYIPDSTGRPSDLLQPLLFTGGIRRFPLGGIPELLRRIREEYSLRRTGYQEMAEHLMSCLLLSLGRAVAGDENPSGQDREPRMDRVGIIDRFFTMGCNRTPRKAELAELLSVSQRQVERVVKELYGMTFREKVLQARMRTAEYLLREYGYSVSRVAELVGYENASSFSGAYKRYYGAAPSERPEGTETTPAGQEPK